MTEAEARAKLISIRSYCFARGVVGRLGGRIGGDDDFRQAFRALNRLYIGISRGNAIKSRVHPLNSGARKRKQAD